MLADPAGLLDGEGKRMRHVKLRVGKELDGEALNDLIDAAYTTSDGALVCASLAGGQPRSMSSRSISSSSHFSSAAVSSACTAARRADLSAKALGSRP